MAQNWLETGDDENLEGQSHFSVWLCFELEIPLIAVNENQTTCHRTCYPVFHFTAFVDSRGGRGVRLGRCAKHDYSQIRRHSLDLGGEFQWQTRSRRNERPPRPYTRGGAWPRQRQLPQFHNGRHGRGNPQCRVEVRWHCV